MTNGPVEAPLFSSYTASNALPRFNLRVALAVTTIAAVVAWQYSIVYRRRAAMDAGHAFILAREAPHAPSGDVQPRVNPLRTLFGDEPVRTIYVIPGNDWERERTRLSKIFPEAKVETSYPPLDGP